MAEETQFSEEELKDNIEKIKQLLESSNSPSGIELLKTIKNQKLIESLSEKIIPAIFDNFFNQDCKPNDINNGNKLLEEFNLIESVKSITIRNNPHIESLDLEKFINIESIYINDCEKLTVIKGLDSLQNLFELDLSNNSLLVVDKNEIENIESVYGATIHDGKWTKLFVKQNDLYWIWDEISEWDDFFAFDCLEDLENSLGDISLVTIPEVSKYGLYNRQYQAMWSYDSKGVYKKYFEGFGPPNKDEVIVVLYTENWNLVTDFTHSKDTLRILCYECDDEYTFEEMIVHDKQAFCEYCVPE